MMSQSETHRAQLYAADVQELGSVFDPLHPHIDAIKRNLIDPFETWPIFPVWSFDRIVVDIQKRKNAAVNARFDEIVSQL